MIVSNWIRTKERGGGIDGLRPRTEMTYGRRPGNHQAEHHEAAPCQPLSTSIELESREEERKNVAGVRIDSERVAQDMEAPAALAGEVYIRFFLKIKIKKAELAGRK